MDTSLVRTTHYWGQSQINQHVISNNTYSQTSPLDTSLKQACTMVFQKKDHSTPIYWYVKTPHIAFPQIQHVYVMEGKNMTGRQIPNQNVTDYCTIPDWKTYPVLMQSNPNKRILLVTKIRV